MFFTERADGLPQNYAKSIQWVVNGDLLLGRSIMLKKSLNL